MELKHIKDLMNAMSRTGTKKLKIRNESFELLLERPDKNSAAPPLPDSGADMPYEDLYRIHHKLAEETLHKNSEQISHSKIVSDHKKEQLKNEDSAKYIVSPMVGTFYTTPTPSDPAFVNVGDSVSKNSVVCIIEAMKVMNEIKANQDGIIAEVLVENGQPIEFGTKLFKLIES